MDNPIYGVAAPSNAIAGREQQATPLSPKTANTLQRCGAYEAVDLSAAQSETGQYESVASSGPDGTPTEAVYETVSGVNVQLVVGQPEGHVQSGNPTMNSIDPVYEDPRDITGDESSEA